ncbi:MAG: beta family protein [Gammaproteobacteria bacterium]
MILEENKYVPVLRWRQGEYQALLRLNSATKDRIMPLICVPRVEFDFETLQLKKTVHDHVHPFVKRYCEKWDTRPAWIALDKSIAADKMNDGSHVFDYIFDGIRPHDTRAIPALSLLDDSATLAAATRVVAEDHRGIALLVRLEDLMTSTLHTKIKEFANAVPVPFKDIDLILDLQAPNFEPYTAFTKALIAALQRLNNLDTFRNLVIVSSAIPKSFKDIAKGTDEIPRHDWLFYQTLLSELPSGMRQPVYGDYTVVHPEFTVPLDMRIIKPVGKIIYTAEEIWATRKGGAFRANPLQMHDHCKIIITDERFQFRGPDFSFGDEYIADCAVYKEEPSTLAWWKGITINHHITTVVDALAKLVAAP